jgi:hypothetical protein
MRPRPYPLFDIRGHDEYRQTRRPMYVGGEKLQEPKAVRRRHLQVEHQEVRSDTLTERVPSSRVIASAQGGSSRHDAARPRALRIAFQFSEPMTASRWSKRAPKTSLAPRPPRIHP